MPNPGMRKTAMRKTAISITDNRLARPPELLVPLIQRELAAGADHYRAAGTLMLEAREGVKHGQFKRWIESNFRSISYRTAAGYMRVAGLKVQRVAPLREAVRDPATRRQHQRHQPRKQTVREADPEESRQVRDMALRVIQAGFKAVAPLCHPDRAGGSVEEMALLNHVRTWLLDVVNDSTVPGR